MSASAGQSPNTMTLHLESRLPQILRRGRFLLDRGSWQQPPPVEVGSYSLATWIAEPNGLLGRKGVKGSVRYLCDWAGSVSVLHIAFECLLFGDRRVVCREENSDGDNCRSEERMFCIHCAATESGLSTLHVVVELQEHMAKYVSVDKHRIKSVSAAENLRGGRLSSVLRQATRSCLVRITNLTPHRLAMDGRGHDVQGFWVTEPSACIDPHSFCDFGITNSGLQLSTRGSVCYVVESPETNRERRVQITINWDVPWLRQRTLTATSAGEVFAVKVFTDRQHNLVGVVHIVDPRCLPTLEVLDAVALASNTNNGETMTELVQEITKPHELIIPSVRVLLGQTQRTHISASKESSPGHDQYTGLQLSYRIGPEVFRRVYSPSERVHLSAAQAGGDGEEETVLSALEARSQESAEQTARPLGPTEQAFLLQRHLADGMTPVVRTRILKVISESDRPEAAHWWPTDMSDIEGETVLDAQGLLQILRHSWPLLAKRRAALRGVVVDKLLIPLEELSNAWANQADMEPALVRKAAVSACELCRIFGLEETAADIEQLVAGHAPIKTAGAKQKVGSQAQVHD